MKRYFALLGFFVVLSVFFQSMQAGQISVINPSAGSEITGLASALPQSSSSYSSSGLSTSNNSSLTDKAVQNSSRYQIYVDFFKTMTFQSFTEAQLVAVKSHLLDVLGTESVERGIKDMIKEQLALVEKRLK